jgi:hypothetical protein
MAQRVEILLVDDVDGSTADETVEFQLDGSKYEIDLSSANAADLRSTIGKWTVHARKVGGRPARRTRRTSLGPSPQAMRIWAQTHGYQLSNRGRVPEAIQAAYRAAHPDE